MSTISAHAPAPGFAEPVHDAQLTFRSLLDALAAPTRAIDITTVVPAPTALTQAAAAAVLTLCDDATLLWLDEPLRNDDVQNWIAFHIGARFTDKPREAAFALVASPHRLPELSSFEQGSDEAPHLSTTIIVIDSAAGEANEDEHNTEGSSYRRVQYTADGPGFEFPLVWESPQLPGSFPAQWEANHARFPRGVDLLIAGPTTVTALPRTTGLSQASIAETNTATKGR